MEFPSKPSLSRDSHLFSSPHLFITLCYDSFPPLYLWSLLQNLLLLKYCLLFQKPKSHDSFTSWFPMEDSGESRRRRRRDGCTVVQCYTPQRLVARWLSGLRSSKGKRETSEEEDEHTGGYQSRPETCRPLTESQSSEANVVVGIGFFLLYLVVVSKTELDKMVNLRMQMEMLLLNAKEELHKKQLQRSPPMSSIDASSYHANDISNLASSIFQESSTSALQEENTECEVSKSEDHIGTREMVVTDERDGVCPYELEKKLHELLETRQQEELLKLKTALRRVERRLQEKETEVSWWKDAVCLLAQRVPESSRAGLEWSNPESSITCSEQSVSRSFKACPKHRISYSR